MKYAFVSFHDDDQPGAFLGSENGKDPQSAFAKFIRENHAHIDCLHHGPDALAGDIYAVPLYKRGKHVSVTIPG